MGRLKYIQCQMRMRSLRSNDINKHLHQHQSKYPIKSNQPMRKCAICQKSIIIWLLPLHIKRHYNSTEQNIKSDDSCIEDVETSVFNELYRQLDVKQQEINRLQVIIQSQHAMLKECDRKFAQKENEINGLFKIIHSQIINVDTLSYNSKNKRWEKYRI